MSQGKVTVYTQVYNTRNYIEKCVTSVLTQTYKNFQYILVDNGCTDGCSEYLSNIAKTDSRIILIRNPENKTGFWPSLVSEVATGEFFALLDSDDWWEQNYLETLVSLLQDNALDIALTGTRLYIEADKNQPLLRKVDQPLCFTLQQFAEVYPKYWTFPSTFWASVLRTDLMRQSGIGGIFEKKYVYGADTMAMLQYLDHCQRIGIDNSAMYHYRIRKSSVSYEYNPKRFEANLAYCDQIRAFLVKHHTFDTQKKEWLKRVYLNSVTESVRLALGARNTLREKLEVCGEIAAHPQTDEALQSTSDERTKFLNMLRQLVSTVIQKGPEEDFEPLLPILRCVCPRCGPRSSRKLVSLCQKDAALLPLLLDDDLTALALALGDLIAQGRYTKQFDLPEILAGLLPDNPISAIQDARFFRKYPGLCADVIKGNNIDALGGMTEALMSRRVSDETEPYLRLYLTLAALEQQVPAFLFGNVQLAQYYLERNNRAACEQVLGELDEMGLAEHEEVVRIRAALKEMEPAP